MNVINNLKLNQAAAAEKKYISVPSSESQTQRVCDAFDQFLRKGPADSQAQHILFPFRVGFPNGSSFPSGV